MPPIVSTFAAIQEASQEVVSSCDPRSLRVVPQAAMLAQPALIGSLVLGSEIGKKNLAEMQRLRHRLGVAEDLRTDLPYLLGFHDEDRRRPATILLRDRQGICAAVVFSELRHMGLSSGIYLAGDLVGDGAIIGNPAAAVSHVQAAVTALFQQRPSAHSVRLCIGSTDTHWPIVNTPGIEVTVQRRSTRRRLKLAKTFPEMLSSFGGHTRRHLQRKRITLEARGGIQFASSLKPSEAFAAMIGLTDSSHPRRSFQQNHHRHNLLHNQPHAFAMALRIADGEWLSFLSGWRVGTRTYIDLQMNNFCFVKESLSAVMRSYMLEHEIALGQTDVLFIGGSSILLQRYCEEDESCFDLLFRRKGHRNRLTERVAKLLGPKALVEYIYGNSTGNADPVD